MLVAILVILASVLALGLLSFLDDSQTGAVGLAAREHKAAPGPQVFHDAFPDTRSGAQPRPNDPQLVA